MAKSRRYKTAREPLGTSPGTLTYVGQEVTHGTRINRIEYNAETFQMDESGRLSLCQLPAIDVPHVTWLDVDGIHQPPVIETIGRHYQLHPLLLEDVVNTEQKPKIEQYNDSLLFVTMKMLHGEKSGAEIDAEHVSFVLGPNFVISFQEERTADIFAPVLERLKASVGKTRRYGADYLLYSLMDLIVDDYFRVLDGIGETLDYVEQRIISQKAGQLTLSSLYALKRELALMRRYVWPLHDMVSLMQRDESGLIRPATQPFLRDLHDHVSQVIETLDAYRDLIPTLMDMHLSTTSNRMNSVMKTLTIFSAIFMPLTFIVGIYGMNFDNMPELHTRYGYFAVLGAMVLVVAGELYYFKRRGWL
jgi:magnesium transporter